MFLPAVLPKGQIGLVTWVTIVRDSLRPYLVIHPKFKTFEDFPSHRMLWHVHGALNIDKK